MAYSANDLKKFYTKSTRTYSLGSGLLIAGFLAVWMGTIYSFILFFQCLRCLYWWLLPQSMNILSGYQ